MAGFDVYETDALATMRHFYNSHNRDDASLSDQEDPVIVLFFWNETLLALLNSHLASIPGAQVELENAGISDSSYLKDGVLQYLGRGSGF